MKVESSMLPLIGKDDNLKVHHILLLLRSTYEVCLQLFLLSEMTFTHMLILKLDENIHRETFSKNFDNTYKNAKIGCYL